MNQFKLQEHYGSLCFNYNHLRTTTYSNFWRDSFMSIELEAR